MKSQYTRIATLLKLRRRKGATYRDLMVFCYTNSPWKRLAEMERMGYTFTRWKTKENDRWIAHVALATEPGA